MVPAVPGLVRMETLINVQSIGDVHVHVFFDKH
jgi:hypothetical protein